jgi:hypothetical protein
MSDPVWWNESWDPEAASQVRESVAWRGRRLHTGDHVLLRPRGRADILDTILSGRTATIESIEQDYEDRIHVAVVVDDDPGQDLGMLRQPGHRFFFSLDDLEPLDNSGEGGP